MRSLALRTNTADANLRRNSGVDPGSGSLRIGRDRWRRAEQIHTAGGELFRFPRPRRELFLLLAEFAKRRHRLRVTMTKAVPAQHALTSTA